MTLYKISKGLKLALDYYKALNDFYLSFFYLISKNYQISEVLYPGSYVHITPSFVFSEVVYVDSYKKSKVTFDDENLLKFVNLLKFYDKIPHIRFHLSDYRADLGEDPSTFDLIISLSSGFISIACDKYLKKGGLFLVDNEHNDASRAYISRKYGFLGALEAKPPLNRHHSHKSKKDVIDYIKKSYILEMKRKIKEGDNILFRTTNLEDYFRTTKNQKLTLPMVEEILEKPPSKLSYRLKKRADLYLFKKL
jgi:hypothetical protein